MSYQYPKLNPDPSAHLIISPTNQDYHYDINSEIIDGKGSHWLFPHHHTFELDHSKPFVYLGVKFHIGALYSLETFSKLLPALDTAEEINPTELLANNNLNEDALIALAKSAPEQCCKHLDALLLPWLIKSKEDQHSKITRKALNILDSVPISELGKQLSCSQRTLERSFSRVTGLTLKQCQSMQKLEAMLEYLYLRDMNNIDWVDVAFQFGFSDQSHLIRYLKKQIGLTPKNYIKERGLTIDVYGSVYTN